MKKNIIPKIIILGFFLILLYVFKKIGITEILDTISKANLLWVLISFISIILVVLFWSLRWKFLLRSKLPLIKFYMLNLVGLFVCSITPSAGAGGEPLKAYYASKLEKRPFTDVFVLTLLDKFVFNNLIFAILVLASLVYLFLAAKIPIGIKTFMSLFLFLLLIVAIIFFIAKASWKSLKKPLTKILMALYSINFIKKRFKSFDQFKGLLKNSAIGLFKHSKKSLATKNILIPASLYSLFSWAFFYFSFYVLFLAIGSSINIFHLIIIVTISKLVGDLSFIPGGIGITESTLLALFIIFPVSPVAAASVVIINRGLFYFVTLVLGYISFSYFGMKHNGKR